MVNDEVIPAPVASGREHVRHAARRTFQTAELSSGIHPAPSSAVRPLGHRKPYIDVMENVFGGVRISTEDDRRRRVLEPAFRARPWLGGLTVSEVEVGQSVEEEDDDDRDER
jgi:hypothetical protein